MIDNAISYYKIKNGYTPNKMIPKDLRKNLDPDHYNFKYRLENFVMKDLDKMNSDVDKTN